MDLSPKLFTFPLLGTTAPTATDIIITAPTVFNSACPKLPWTLDFFPQDTHNVLDGQLKASTAETTLQYRSSLDVKSRTSVYRGTQLVCTLSPNISDAILEELLFSGMSVARIIATSNNKEQAMQLCAQAKTASEYFSKKIGRVYPLAIALEIRGPEIRIGTLLGDKDEIFLSEGEVVIITTDETFADKVTSEIIYVNDPKLPEMVQPGSTIILGDSTVRLSALQVAESIIRCIVEKAGNLISRDSVTIRDSVSNKDSVSSKNSATTSDSLKTPTPPSPIVSEHKAAVSDEDIELLELAIEKNIDFIFVAETVSRESIHEVKKILGRDAKQVRIIAKLENIHAIENIDEIIEHADAVCLDCDRLLFDIPKEKLFLVQKSVLAKCNIKGKPVICSIGLCDLTTIEKSEVCDIANAVIDGADALLIPEKGCTRDVLRDICSVCKEAEPSIHHKFLFRSLINYLPTPADAVRSICLSAVETSWKLGAAAIVCLTNSGFTPVQLAMFRPRCPIITVTRFDNVARMLRLYKGVEPVIYVKPFAGDHAMDIEERLQLAVTFGKVMGFIKMDDQLIAVTGAAGPNSKVDNVRVFSAADFDVNMAKLKAQKSERVI